MSDKIPYIDMDFDEALELKYQSGLKKHRKHGGKFVGDAVAELFEEMLDSIHYVVEMEKDGVEIPGMRTTLKNMALSLQARRRELKRRI